MSLGFLLGVVGAACSSGGDVGPSPAPGPGEATAIAQQAELSADEPSALSTPDIDQLTGAQQTKLLATDGQPSDELGISIAMSGNTVIVGADHDDDNGIDAGAAYVFTQIAGVWVQEAKLLPSDGAAGAYFGLAVAIEGDTAVVGAFLDDANGADSGSAYIFERSGGVWTQEAKLSASDGQSFDDLGRTVALSGDTALLGALGLTAAPQYEREPAAMLTSKALSITSSKIVL